MAKSLRSKWKRKMRAKKREKNAPRELEKLKKILASSKDCKDVIMTEDVCQIQKGSEIKGNLKVGKSKDEDQMEVENKRDKKSMLDENGQYPKWMHGRAIKKMKQKRKKKGKLGNKKLLAW
ncbi:protein LLP homolog [Styela clava]